jgi:sodium pump decarboxylase gamma subunit
MNQFMFTALGLVLSINTSASSSHEEVDFFILNDPYGALMAILGMGIVFIVLLILFLVFSITPRFYKKEFKDWWANLLSRKPKSEKSDAEKLVSLPVAADDLSGEVNAAIAAAIYLYQSELHDYENTVLTISKVSRTYSPWSSKIYGLRKVPREH